MKNKYLPKYLPLICVLLITAVVSCKKDKTTNKTSTTINPTGTNIGLFEYKDSVDANDVYYRIFIPITQVGNQTVNYDEVFDTGSAGLTLDASGIIPDSLITNNGFKFIGDSVVVNGVTITSHTSVMEYGDALSGTNVYGNVAYASITLGNQTGSGVTIKRVPIFLYYKVLDITGKDSVKETTPHSADIFGVSPEYSYASTLIQSPLSYYTPGTGLTNGFKLSKLVQADFTNNGVYEQNILTLGLTNADLNSSGFIMHNYASSYTSVDGYSPDIPGTITYNGNTISANFLFDTGTPQISIIEDPKATQTIGVLPANSTITLKTQDGFSYTYTTAKTTNVTEVQNPKNTDDYRTIFSLEFFTTNEFLTNYTGHEIGLKNN
ncbi:hypothetical protein HDF19_17380 [Mucilaginibacter sp. E4BP6]|uniref:hypothetical protein n=1 Tax=Mucilaginibacter sp. E4BP6 TaxID=2723089 RepID=UPI0015C95DF4|nr:hypothetical protein [Mucilaginibacter sp. E4BP6]NYE66338.1 hypothetical protein [Mucilaginibacter sp. E4BP6]